MAPMQDVLMLRAITDLNLPKFLDEDVPLFKGILSDPTCLLAHPEAAHTLPLSPYSHPFSHPRVFTFAGILSDLFPGVALPELDYDNLRAALTQNAVRMNLQPLPSFLDKAIQLYEMIIVRHGLMLVRADLQGNKKTMQEQVQECCKIIIRQDLMLVRAADRKGDKK
eukprot:scaffold25264_cov18-Tisochrysis_lutea.AAC.1